MGNLKSKDYVPIEQMEIATEEEVTNRDVFPFPVYKLQRFTGSGDNFEEALKDLKSLCYKNGVPEPEKYYDLYCCGKIDLLYLTCTKTKMNPVFHKERNGRHFAIVYYPRI